MAKVRFHKGLKANLPSTGLVSGHYYQCTDTGEIFLATSATDLLLVGHGNKVYLPIEGGNITGTLSVKNNEVFHKGNADNASTVWHVKSLDIGSTTAVEHIRFHREGFNYVVAPSASINFASGPAAANTVMHVNIASKRVGVGTTSPKYTLEVDGSFAAESGKIDGNDIYHKGNLVDIPESALDSSVRAKLNQVLFGHLENGQFIKEGESTPVTPAAKTLYVDTTSHSEYVWNATDGFVPMGGGGSVLAISALTSNPSSIALDSSAARTYQTCDISTRTSITLSGGNSNPGYEHYILFHNTGSSDCVITPASGMVAPETIPVKAGKYLELSYIYNGASVIITHSSEIGG